MEARQLKLRTQRFALDIIQLTESLPNKPSGWVLGKTATSFRHICGSQLQGGMQGQIKSGFSFEDNNCRRGS